MIRKQTPGCERRQYLNYGLFAMGVAVGAVAFAPLESREAALPLDILWLVDVVVGALCLILYALWEWLEPRRLRAAIKWEARLRRWRLAHYRRLGTLSPMEVGQLASWIDTQERAALRRVE